MNYIHNDLSKQENIVTNSSFPLELLFIRTFTVGLKSCPRNRLFPKLEF